MDALHEELPVYLRPHTVKRKTVVRLRRRVKLSGKWTFASIARQGGHILWDHVLVDGQPQKVEGGSFYVKWTENGIRRNRSLATLDPLLAIQAKADLETELGLADESSRFTRQPVEPATVQIPLQSAEVFGYVYRVTHKASGRVYIGQTRNMVILRWREHARSAYAGRGSSFQKALRVFGAESFIWETIASAPDQAMLDAIEKRWIAAHQASNPEFGFNIRD